MNLISSLRQSCRCKKIIYWSIALILLIYIFSVPSFGEASNFTRYLVYVSMALLGFVVFIYCFLYEDFRINRVLLLVPAFCVFALIGTIAYSHVYRSWMSLVLLTISFFIFVYAFKAIKNKYIIIAIISAAFFLFSLYYIIHYRREILDYRSYTNDSFRLGWFFDNPNDISAYAVVGVATPLYLVLFWNSKIKYLFIAHVISSLIVGLTTGSRTFLLMLFLLLLVFLYFKFQKHKFIYLGIVVGIIVFGIILLNLPFLNTMKERLIQAIQSIFGTATKIDTSTLQRTVMIDYGFYLGSKRIFFGFGADGFSIASGIGTYAHSNFVEVLCDFGLIGFLLFYAPLIIFLYRALTTKRIDKSFVVTFIAYYLIVGFSNVFFYKKIYYLVLAFLFYSTYLETAKKVNKRLVSCINNVVFTCDSMVPGGAEKVIASISNELVKKGVNVFIVGVADFRGLVSFYELNPKVKYVGLKSKNKKRIPALKRLIKLRRLLVSFNPDVVISFLPNANIYTWLSLIGTKIPHIVSERNNPYVDPKSRITRFLKYLSFLNADGHVFQTKGAMNYYCDGIKYNGVVINNPISLEIDQLKDQPNRNKTVLAVGRLTEQKNYPLLFEAFSIFNNQNNNLYNLKIYGDGPKVQELKDYCIKLGIDSCVIFAGEDSKWHQKELNDAMYILSSDYEGMPNALAEAMAIGIPSISTDCPSGGSRELIVNGVNGFLVPINDVDSLVNAMNRINTMQYDFFKSTRSMINDYSVSRITACWIEYITRLSKDSYE